MGGWVWEHPRGGREREVGPGVLGEETEKGDKL